MELATPDLDQIKQGEQGARDRGGRFAKGRSGNPAGRLRGCCLWHNVRPTTMSAPNPHERELWMSGARYLIYSRTEGEDGLFSVLSPLCRDAGD
jgi:hypothetical protein